MPCLPDACFGKAGITVHAVCTVSMHMVLGEIRIGYNCKVHAIMSRLGSLLFARTLSEAAVFVYRRLFEAIA